MEFEVLLFLYYLLKNLSWCDANERFTCLHTEGRCRRGLLMFLIPTALVSSSPEACLDGQQREDNVLYV